MTTKTTDADRPPLITTTLAEIAGRPTQAVLGVVAGEGGTGEEALVDMEERANDYYDADAVLDIRVIVQATEGGAGRTPRFCAFGTAVALARCSARKRHRGRFGTK